MIDHRKDSAAIADSWPPGARDTDLATLQERHFPNTANVDMAGLISDPRLGETAIVSSFGAESAVLLHYINNIRPGLPVLFLDTGKHFDETLIYRDLLCQKLELNLQIVLPSQVDIEQEDPSGELHRLDPNTCCAIRKTFPLQDALVPYDSWISGRKRFQGRTRAALPIIERDGEKIKVNPLAIWSAEEVAAYLERHALPRHPLVSQGFPSIGCQPCTQAVKKGDDPRAGRWADLPDKSECGIHLSPDGTFSRTSD
jgi:phosphoadenosine phosphosulfate reductase